MQNQQSAKQRKQSVSTAIQQYIQRQTHPQGQEGPKDLKTLSENNIPTLFQAFNSSLEFGLTSANVEANGKLYGKNEYKKRRTKTFCQFLKQAIRDEMIIILIAAAIISIVVEYLAGEDKQTFWIDGVSIMVAAIVCILLSTISNYQKQKKFEELDQMTESTYNYEVIRDGRRQQVHRSKIVPGDMIFITYGMQIPADCILYRGVNVSVNQSAITGESVEVDKDVLQKCMEERMNPKCPTPLMISGSNIISGEGIMMAAVVGKESRAGKSYQLIFSKEEQQDEQTPLEYQLSKLAKIVGRFGVISAIVIFIILVARLLIQQIQKGGFTFQANLNKLIHYLIIAVTVVVVSIPQGLPLAVTITLAFSMKAMHKDKILVRNLDSCQIMGTARYLCSDKTGTITQNKMSVMQILNTRMIPIQQFIPTRLHKDYFTKLTQGIFHNTSAIVQTQKGPQTEIALLKMVRKLTGQDQEKVRKQIGPEGYFKRLPFDSSRKRMTTGFTLNNQNLLFMTGASQHILDACDFLQNCQTNQIEPITPQKKKQIQQQLQVMASQGLRTVSVAYKPVVPSNLSLHKQFSRDDDILQQIQKDEFTMLGIFGIEDPPRPQSKQAIQNCNRAGIKVIMVTGDNKITAKNIAEDVGILSPQRSKVLQASELIKILEEKGLLHDVEQNQSKVKPQASYNKSKKQKNLQKAQSISRNKVKKVILRTQEDERVFQQVLQDLAVVARSKPEHKYILVDGIDKVGHIVGVTGDGANDAPALVRADIGLAMGITGTQVAKNASDIIILDDKFDSIVKAVVWGRNVYTSIRKFIQFQLTVNLIAICIVLVSAAVIRQSVLASIQMLWVNLIMDSVAALALATQPPNFHQLINQPPNNPDERLITRTMLKHIIGQTILQLIVLTTLLFVGQMFIPEYRDSFDDVIGQDLSAKYLNGIPEGTIADGKFYTISGGENYKPMFDKYKNYSRHFTFIFNTFVFLQVFNFICCRRIKDQLNIFQNIFASKLFWIVLAVIVGLQILVITFGKNIFEVYRYGGLTIIQWLISVGIGSLTIPWSIFLRLLPICKPVTPKYQRERKAYNKLKDFVED